VFNAPGSRSRNRAKKENQMKLIPVAAVLAALAFVPAVLAQTTTATPANKADCEKAKMKWDAKGGKDGKGACMAPAPAKTEAPKK
jgi:hypothetical protein